MELQTLYKAILQSLHVTVDDDGLLSMIFQGQKYPMAVEGTRLALPTPERLRSGAWDGLMAFHPLSENLLRGESPVLKKLKGIATLRFHAVISELMMQFVAIGADTSTHASLSPKAQELLSHIPEVDEKSVQAMEKILEAASPDGPNRLISIYLKRGGNFKGTRYSRLAVVSFPFLDEFKGEERTVFGVKLRKNDYAAFEQLFRYILPDADDLETYSAGSQSMVAPYFDSLVQAFIKLSRQLNAIIKLHKKQLENADDLLFDMDWEDEARDLSRFSGVIPGLAGNDGELLEGTEPSAEAAAPKPIPSILTPSAPKAAAPTPVAPKAEPAKSASPFNTNFPMTHAAPAAAATTGEAVKVDELGVKHTKRGVDFDSLMQARNRAQQGFNTPAVAATAAWPGGTGVVAPTATGHAPPGTRWYRGVLVDQMGRPVNQAGFGFGTPMVNTPGPVLPDWAQTPQTQQTNQGFGFANQNTGFGTGGYGGQAWGGGGV